MSEPPQPATDHEVLALLQRMCDRLETIEELLRDFVEQNDETERRWQRCLAALSLAAGNSVPHED